MFTLVDTGALKMVINALKRDAESGLAARGEMADELLGKAAVVQPIHQMRRLVVGSDWEPTDADRDTCLMRMPHWESMYEFRTLYTQPPTPLHREWQELSSFELQKAHQEASYEAQLKFAPRDSKTYEGNLLGYFYNKVSAALRAKNA